MMEYTLSDVFRFWLFVDKTDDCWNWREQGSRKYGNFSLNTKTVLAHRFSYLIHNGSLDPNLQVCHTCDNTKCVNPLHLFQGTQKENREDCKRKGRTAKGVEHGLSKLNHAQVKEIKFKLGLGMTRKEIGRLYNVSENCIACIAKGFTWAEKS